MHEQRKPPLALAIAPAGPRLARLLTSTAMSRHVGTTKSSGLRRGGVAPSRDGVAGHVIGQVPIWLFPLPIMHAPVLAVPTATVGAR